MTRRWYDFCAQAKGAEIVIYDEIGAFGIPAKAFLDELKALGPIAELTVRMNSPGGSVFDGVAIYNALKRHGAVMTVWIDGIAASIASMIAMAGDEVVMPENAMLMLHDPSGLVMGTAADTPQPAAEAARPAEPPPQATAQVIDLEAVRADERRATLAYVAEVHELCALAGRGDLAAGFVAKATPVAQIRRALLEARAAEDEATTIRSH